MIKLITIDLDGTYDTLNPKTLGGTPFLFEITTVRVT